MSKAVEKSIIPIERIASKIYLIRNEKVMLDSDLAELYEVPTGRLNEQVKRNISRFPEDFAFQLQKEEFDILISHFAISSSRHGGRRKLPWVFTEHGTLMLSSILRSDRAAQVNIAIVRAFVRMREMLATHKEVARKIEEHDRHIANLYEHVEKLLSPPSGKKNPMGYIWHNDEN